MVARAEAEGMAAPPEIERGRVHLFVYGTLRAGSVAHELLDGCTRLREASVGGVLYDVDGRFPALMLYGAAPVHGEIWECPDTLIYRLDEYEGTRAGLFRRVAVSIDGYDCWTYVAGPALSRQLMPAQRIASGRWTTGDDAV
jgi:gamma-glutamylcyclotransferase (GGCT)/AIG2-like uncharacterized protein YtfP